MDRSTRTASITAAGLALAASAALLPLTAAADAKGWVDYDPPAAYPKTVTINNQWITMADGTRLAASVTLPADAGGVAIHKRFPVVLTQTGYNKDIGAYVPAIGGGNTYLVTHGYAHVVVDVRGTGRSDGEWEAFGETEQADYYPTVQWAATQSFSNGKVGLYGASLLGITSVLTSAKQHPAVKAAFPIVPMADSYRDIVFNGGQVNAAFIPLWLGLVTGLSVIDPSILQDDPAQGTQAMLTHLLSAVDNFQVPLVLKAAAGDPATAYDGPFWRIRSPIEQAANVNVPTFIVGGLHDIFQRGEPMLYESLKDHVPAKLLIGPWTHVQAAMGEGLPLDGVPVLDHIALQWFDQYVRGKRSRADRLPNVTQYVWGFDHFVSSTDWPHPKVRAQRLYLRGDGSLGADQPVAGEKSRLVVQQPLDGVCTPSTAQWTAGLLGFVPLPCVTSDNLDELLEAKYDTPVMTEDYYLNGPIEADVWVSSTAQETGVVVRVDDVDENGRAFALSNGVLTSAHRAVDDSKSRFLGRNRIQPWHPFTQAAQQTTGIGNTVLLPVETFPTSALIKAGHKLRISVGPSDLPHGLPPVPQLLPMLAGVIAVHSDSVHPSSVVVPVVPARFAR